jgi:predicted phage gp36 major capsid-like protein
VLTNELNAYAAREPEYALAQKQTQGKLDRAEIEVKRLTRQYEAARRKAEFLESQSAGVAHAGGFVHPLQPSHAIMNQAVRSSPSGGESHLQPIPVAQSLLPPTFSKKL